MNSLWMGNLESYMHEDFIHRAFAAMGETVLRVRIIRNKITGEPAGYCFVEFADDATVERCLRRVNGKPLPGASLPKRFKLNRATYGRQAESPTFSIFVSDLTPDVDDGMLYEFFCTRFPSCCSGKIVLDSGGYSKGCGFVSFTSQSDQKRALAKFQGAFGLGKKQLRLDFAAVKPNKKQPTGDQTGQNHTEDYSQNQQYLYDFYVQQYSSYYSAYCNTAVDDNLYPNISQDSVQSYEDMEDDGLEYPNLDLDVLEANRMFMEKSEELYDAMISCHYQPPELWGGLTCSVMCCLPEPVLEYEENGWQ